MGRVMRAREGFAAEAAMTVNAISVPVFLVNAADRLVFVNFAAEVFFGGSAGHLHDEPLASFLPEDCPLLGLIAAARRDELSLSDYHMSLDSPRLGQRIVNVQVAPVNEYAGHVAVSLQEQSVATTLEAQMSHRGSARSVTAMGAMLAHEVKNPLSGIRGAAQLLEQSADESDVPLTQLICDEADRIVKLVERMEAFGEDRPVTKAPVNIHEVLEHCRRLAQNGFGRHVRFSEFYDPSLPPVIGNRDMLVQIFINVIKNACEASGRDDAEIELATAYRHGMRVAVAGTRERVHLPLQVTVRDNGPGIPAELHRHLFDAFVTTKINGSGLGLAFVAKAVADHGGVVRVETGGEGTTFRFSLPIAQVERDSPATNGSRAAAH